MNCLHQTALGGNSESSFEQIKFLKRRNAQRLNIEHGDPGKRHVTDLNCTINGLWSTLRKPTS